MKSSSLSSSEFTETKSYDSNDSFIYSSDDYKSDFTSGSGYSLNDYKSQNSSSQNSYSDSGYSLNDYKSQNSSSQNSYSDSGYSLNDYKSQNSSSQNSYSDSEVYDKYTIHHIWVGPPIPKKYLKNMENWKKMCPKYKFMFHTDIRILVEKYFPNYLKQFDNFEKEIERIDFVRCIIMYVWGGVYMDLDVLPLQPLDKWLEMDKIIFGYEGKHGGGKRLGNSILFSPPKQKFWKHYMDYIMDNYKKNKKVVENTGPIALTNFYNKNKHNYNNLIITDHYVFYNGRGNDDRCFTKHLWDGTWKDDNNNTFILYLVFFGILLLIFIIMVVIYARS